MTALLLASFLFLQSLPESVNRFLYHRNGQNFDRYSFNTPTSRVIQATDGVLWVGTPDGLLSFNGYESVRYKRSLLDTNGQYFVGSYVSALLEDTHGNIWASVAQGSWNVLPNGEERFLNFMDVADFGITDKESLIELDDGRILSNSKTGFHFLSYNKETGEKQHEVVTYEELDIEKKFNKIYKGKNGKLYGTSDGLYEIRITEDFIIEFNLILTGKESWHFYQIENDKFIISDVRDGKNILIIYKIGGQPVEHNIPYININSRRVQSILRDNGEMYWVVTNDGVNRFRLDDSDNIYDQFNYDLGNVRDVMEDNSGNIFFASNVGLLKLNWNYDQYRYISLPEELRRTYVFKYHTDINGNYWIGHQRGLLKYNVREESFITIEESRRAHSITEDGDGNIWIGDPSSLKVFDYRNGDLIYDFKNGSSIDLSFDGFNNVWFISNGVLNRVKSNSKEIEQFQIGFDVERIFLDENALWVQTRKRDLRKFALTENGPELVAIYLTDFLENQINWIEDDLLGNLWLSTKRGVIIIDKINGEVEQLLNSENILADDDIFEIIRDSSGIMWVKSSAVGSMAINPETREALSFTPSWLAQPGFSGYFCVNAVNDSGSLFTDGRGGFFVFHPDSIKKNPTEPFINLNSAVANQSIEIEEGSRLSYKENDFNFTFAAIQYDNIERNEYAYYLEGYEDNWNYVGGQRFAQYLSIPPGEYSFLVKAANSDGIWSDPVELAAFRILPPWWGNSIAYSIYLLIFGLIGYRFYQAQLTRRIAESEAERLKEVDEFKSRFFTNISHEFRTPLTVIMGLADRINHESTPIIKRNASKLLELINQILELSKLEANQSNLKKERFDFVQYSNYTIESLSTLANERGIELKTETDIDELFVEMDKQKVDLIIHNLLSNALKFTDKGGAVFVQVSKETESIIFSVKDTGIGIRREELDQIFNRFFQTDLENHRYEGTGIGLALTKELVHLLNGNIHVESEFGSGSTFIVELPCAFIDPEIVVEQKTDTLIKSAQKITNPEDSEVILLVEDNYDVRNFIKQILSNEYQIVVAHNGREGVEKAIESIPDLILTDVMMPYKDGFELTEELKKDARTSHIPIIMLTAKADVESRVSGLKTGADVYLGKPFNEEELKTNIHNLINLRNSIRKQYGGEIQVNELGNSMNDEFVKKIHDSIIQNLDDELFGIEQVCRTVGVSRTQLHRKLKAITGKSSSIFIRDIRLVEARKMLKNTELTVSEIAYSVGFSDPKYFSKLYSEKFSNPPSKEREIID
ncbi:MAG: two-component regulator propeller domain-containing protein [Balneolaceae bacterium]